MRTIAISGRWRSERQAAEYAGALLDWAWGAPPTLPWTGLDGGVQCRATGIMDMWPMGTIFGVAGSTTPKHGERRGSGRKPEPYVISSSSDSCDVQGILGSAAAAVRLLKTKPRARPKAQPKPARDDAAVRATNAAVPQVRSDASPHASLQRTRQTPVGRSTSRGTSRST